MGFRIPFSLQLVGLGEKRNNFGAWLCVGARAKLGIEREKIEFYRS